MALPEAKVVGMEPVFPPVPKTVSNICLSVSDSLSYGVVAARVAIALICTWV